LTNYRNQERRICGNGRSLNEAVLRQAGCAPAEALCGLTTLQPAQALVNPRPPQSRHPLAVILWRPFHTKKNTNMTLDRLIKILFGILICYSATAFSQNKENGVLISYVSTDSKYTTILLTIENDKVKYFRSYPFTIVPEKSEENNLTGKLLFLLVDTLSQTNYEKSYGLIVLHDLKKALNFKDTFEVDNPIPTEEEIKLELEKEHGITDWNDEDAKEILENAIRELRFYENYGINISYIFYPHITLMEWGESYTGGAHGNWYNYEFTNKFYNSFSTGSIRIPNLLDSNDRLWDCEEMNDSLFSLLEQEAIEGKFIDKFTHYEEENPDNYKDSYFIGDPSDTYCILDRINGEPHWLIRADAPADYANSGDYALTVQIDLGVIDERYKKNNKYEISSPENHYGIDIQSNILRVYNSNDKLIYEYELRNTFAKVILEEWAMGKQLTSWKEILKK
jgi:hypothetical protein